MEIIRSPNGDKRQRKIMSQGSKDRKNRRKNMKREDIIKELVERGYNVQAQDIIKNGVSLEGILIKDDSATAPIIYTEHLIDAAEAYGKSLSEVVDVVIRAYEQRRNKSLNVNQFLNRDFILSHIYVGLQKKSNEDIEKKTCDLEGLESFLYIRSEEGQYSAKLNQNIMKSANLAADEAWERAKKNTFAETQVQSVASLLAEMSGISFCKEMEAASPLYIISNKWKFRGASAILDKRALAAFGKEHGADKLIAIPSSIHEMLIMPYEDNADLDAISDMVTEINLEQVEPEERLTDRAYLIEL